MEDSEAIRRRRNALRRRRFWTIYVREMGLGLLLGAALLLVLDFLVDPLI
jgi:hypothetical protein